MHLVAQNETPREPLDEIDGKLQPLHHKNAVTIQANLECSTLRHTPLWLDPKLDQYLGKYIKRTTQNGGRGIHDEFKVPWKWQNRVDDGTIVEQSKPTQRMKKRTL